MISARSYQGVVSNLSDELSDMSERIARLVDAMVGYTQIRVTLSDKQQLLIRQAALREIELCRIKLLELATDLMITSVEVTPDVITTVTLAAMKTEDKDMVMGMAGQVLEFSEALDDFEQRLKRLFSS